MSSVQQPAHGRDVQFRGRTTGGGSVGERDVEVIVTGETLTVRPMTDAEDGGQEPFTVPFAAVKRLRCQGFLSRSVALETDEGTYTVSMDGLDEREFRRAIVEHADLENDCRCLDLGRFGSCPCSVATTVGCGLAVVGFAIILSIVGALLGAMILAVGLGLLGVAFGLRTFQQWRGANVWERVTNGAGKPA